MQQTRVLIVEDERIILLDLKALLERSGYVVSGVASSGAEAIRIARETVPDLILMDVDLQGSMDGIEAGERIGSTLPSRIIYLTSRTNDERIGRYRRYCSGYLAKPFTEEEILESLGSVKSIRNR